MATYQGPLNSGGVGGGTVESVVAGTNITVDATDPANPIVANSYSAAGAISAHAAITTTHGISAFGATLVDDADAAAARTTLGLGSVENTALTAWAGSTAITTLGTIATGTWSGTAIAANKGGTGQTTYAIGDILYASSTSALSRLAVGTNGYVLTLAAGVPTWAAASGGITGFTSSLNTAAPNGTTNVAQLLTATASADGSIALTPKGTGGILAQVPDNTTTGGNARGTYFVDLQMSRNAATQVAGGSYSTVIGGRNTATGSGATAIGFQNTASGGYSVAMGYGNTASGTASVCLAYSSSMTGNYSAGFGYGLNYGGSESLVFGNNVQGSGSNSFVGGVVCTNQYNYNMVVGSYCTTGGPFQSVIGQKAAPPGWRGYFTGGYHSGFNGVFTAGLIQLYNVTTNNTPTILNSDGTLASEFFTVPANVVIACEMTLTARESTTGDCKVIRRNFVIKRGALASSTALLGSVETIGTDVADAGASAWSAAVTADTTNGRVSITVTGETSKTICWQASLKCNVIKI